MTGPLDERAPLQAAVKTAGLDLLDVDGLGALVAHLLFVRDLRSFGEGAIPVADDARVVDEQVSAALIGRDEAEALVVAEPLHGSGGHMQPVLHGSCVLRPWRREKPSDLATGTSPLPGMTRPDGRKPTRNRGRHRYAEVAPSRSGTSI